jgi:hypothetical protein
LILIPPHDGHTWAIGAERFRFFIVSKKRFVLTPLQDSALVNFD